MPKQKIQLIEKQIIGQGQLVRISEDLDRDFEKLTGIAVLWTAGKGHLLRSSSIDTKELFPKDFELAFLQSNTYVGPNERFFKLRETAKGNKIEFDFQDGAISKIRYPYTLKIYLLLENE